MSGTCRSMAGGKQQLQHVDEDMDEAVLSVLGWKGLKVTCQESPETEQSMRGWPAPTRAGQAAEEVAQGCPGLRLPASLPWPVNEEHIFICFQET